MLQEFQSMRYPVTGAFPKANRVITIREEGIEEFLAGDRVPDEENCALHRRSCDRRHDRARRSRISVRFVCARSRKS